MEKQAQQMMWMLTYAACAATGKGTSDCQKRADAAVDAFKARWPAEKDRD